MLKIVNIIKINIVKDNDELMDKDSNDIDKTELSWKCSFIKLVISKKIWNCKTRNTYKECSQSPKYIYDFILIRSTIWLIK